MIVLMSCLPPALHGFIIGSLNRIIASQTSFLNLNDAGLIFVRILGLACTTLALTWESYMHSLVRTYSLYLPFHDSCASTYMHHMFASKTE